MGLEQLGKYKILGKIGQGAMGEVYKGHDPVLNRFVAIKTVTSSLSSDEQFRKRFHREARSAAALSHRNIVTIFEFGEEGGVTFMAMELLEGTDLKDRIARRSLPRLEDKLSIIDQICDGLAYAHEKGVVHRDLKPANIHVLPNDTVRIMDFGLARLGASDMTKAGTVMGTPNYMSPEQVRGEKADERSDVFSVGALAYEVLAGRKPFESETMHTVLFQVLDKDPEPLRTVVPDLPIPVVRVVEKALAKDPAGRFQNAGEMRNALRAARRAVAASRAAAVALGAPDAEATLGIADGPTLIKPAAEMGTGLPTMVARDRRTIVTGATALDPTRIAPSDRDLPSTARPDLTLHGEGEEEPGRSPAVWLAVGAAVIALAVAGGLFLRGRQTAPARPAADISREQERMLQEGVLKETLVAGHIEIARGDLENKDYQAAVTQAQSALQYDPANAEAREVLGKAQRALNDLDEAARQAREAVSRGDTDSATKALGRVLAIDPRHPVVKELTAALNQHFRERAEEARAQAVRARAEAQPARARAAEGFGQAERLTAAAEDLLRKGQFTEATQRFLEAADGYGRARRAAEEAAAVAAAAAAAAAARPAPTPPPATVPSSIGPAAPVRPSVAAQAPPSQAPSLPPPVAAPTAVPAPAAPPTLAARGGPEPAVRSVIADYGRAIETKDIGLFKTVMPELSSDNEKRLTDAFKAIKSQQVRITVESVEIDGGQAVVRVSRLDTINGKAQPAQSQVFRLVQKGAAWTIQSIGR
jgi:tetratricopeptide (TPR) repeat protein